MEPSIDPDEYVFCFMLTDLRSEILSPAIMEFKEREGTTLILRRSDAEKESIEFVYPCRMITLNVHSSLEAVGFLAAITKKLAEAGISVNAVSAYFHDHIFVPSNEAEKVVGLLEQMISEC